MDQRIIVIAATLAISACAPTQVVEINETKVNKTVHNSQEMRRLGNGICEYYRYGNWVQETCPDAPPPVRYVKPRPNKVTSTVKNTQKMRRVGGGMCEYFRYGNWVQQACPGSSSSDGGYWDK